MKGKLISTLTQGKGAAANTCCYIKSKPTCLMLIASIYLSTKPALGIIWNFNNIKWRIFQGNMIGNNDLFAINIITRKKVQYLSLKKKPLRHVLLRK